MCLKALQSKSLKACEGRTTDGDESLTRFNHLNDMHLESTYSMDKF